MFLVKKIVFNCESSNLTFIVICQRCKEEHIEETGCHIYYRQHIRKPQYQQLAVEEHLGPCEDGKFHMFPFLRFFKKTNH